MIDMRTSTMVALPSYESAESLAADEALLRSVAFPHPEGWKNPSRCEDYDEYRKKVALRAQLTTMS